MDIAVSAMLTVLLVVAHPDDETVFGGFIYALTHKLNAWVDLMGVTIGKGGFRQAALPELFYCNLKLSEEAIGSGRILGIRNFSFTIKWVYNTVDTVFANQWNKEWVIEQFQQTLKYGNGANGYHLMVVLLPSVHLDGHHTASALLALEAIDRMQQVKSSNIQIPTVIGGWEFVLTDPPTYPGNRQTEVLTNVAVVEFDFKLRWKVNNKSFVDYQTVLFLDAC